MAGAAFNAYFLATWDSPAMLLLPASSSLSFPRPQSQPLAPPAAPTRLFPQTGSESKAHAGANSTREHAPAQHTQNNWVHADARAIHSRSSSSSARLARPTNI